jgi:hypothetical protein
MKKGALVLILIVALLVSGMAIAQEFKAKHTKGSGACAMRMRLIVQAIALWSNNHQKAHPTPAETYSAEFKKYMKTVGCGSFNCPATGNRYRYAVSVKKHRFDLVCPNPKIHNCRNIYFFFDGGTVFVDSLEPAEKTKKE